MDLEERIGWKLSLPIGQFRIDSAYKRGREASACMICRHCFELHPSSRTDRVSFKAGNMSLRVTLTATKTAAPAWLFSIVSDVK